MNTRKKTTKKLRKTPFMTRKGSWWIALFLLACYGFYSQAMHKKSAEYAALQKRLSSLEHAKERALQEREELLLQIHSQEDPAWIQMTLMKTLGLVPEGQVKVYFQKKDPALESGAQAP